MTNKTETAIDNIRAQHSDDEIADFAADYFNACGVDVRPAGIVINRETADHTLYGWVTLSGDQITQLHHAMEEAI